MNKYTNGLPMIQLLYCRKKTYFGWKITSVGKCLFTHHTCKIITATRLKKISLLGVLHAQQVFMGNILFFLTAEKTTR